MDSHVKKVLEYLQKTGELDNTLVVYTSDHGMPFPRVKGRIFEHGYNVPLAIRWGKNIPKPRVEDTFINVRDFAPTFLELAGVPKHPQMTGKSFLSLLTSPNPPRYRTVYACGQRAARFGTTEQCRISCPRD